MLSFFEYAAIVAMILFCCNPSVAGTTFDVTSGFGSITAAEQQEIADSFQAMVDKNGPAYANAFFFSNSLGYAIGKSTLGSFPHFELGSSVNAGLTNMENFQHSKNGVYNGSVPGVGPSPIIHFGMGLAGGFDFIGKFMSYNQEVWSVPVPDNRYFNLDTLSIYAIGGRVRYNYITEKTFIPFLLKFGGLTFAAGGDFMRGLFGINGTYTFEMPQQTINSVTVNPYLDGPYTLDITWYQLSASAQATAYFDIMYLFSFYTGFGLTVGYGWFNFDFEYSGDVTNGENGAAIGTASFVSKNKYNPGAILPVYIAGLEINIALIKIVAETQVNLRNRSDVSASVGARIQI